ncbi:nuclear export mediator factor NEMF-like protein [Sesbania bispinosa]|nr:nuclear export mediator factor NEMF-like protein [Sesbania bispinosa]
MEGTGVIHDGLGLKHSSQPTSTVSSMEEEGSSRDTEGRVLIKILAATRSWGTRRRPDLWGNNMETQREETTPKITHPREEPNDREGMKTSGVIGYSTDVNPRMEIPRLTIMVKKNWISAIICHQSASTSQVQIVETLEISNDMPICLKTTDREDDLLSGMVSPVYGIDGADKVNRQGTDMSMANKSSKVKTRNAATVQACTQSVAMPEEWVQDINSERMVPERHTLTKGDNWEKTSFMIQPVMIDAEFYPILLKQYRDTSIDEFYSKIEGHMTFLLSSMFVLERATTS